MQGSPYISAEVDLTRETSDRTVLDCRRLAECQLVVESGELSQTFQSQLVARMPTGLSIRPLNGRNSSRQWSLVAPRIHVFTLIAIGKLLWP